MRPVGAGHAPQRSDLVAVLPNRAGRQSFPGTRTVLVVIDKQLDGRRQLQGAAGSADAAKVISPPRAASNGSNARVFGRRSGSGRLVASSAGRVSAVLRNRRPSAGAASPASDRRSIYRGRSVASRGRISRRAPRRHRWPPLVNRRAPARRPSSRWGSLPQPASTRLVFCWALSRRRAPRLPVRRGGELCMGAAGRRASIF